MTNVYKIEYLTGYEFRTLYVSHHKQELVLLPTGWHNGLQSDKLKDTGQSNPNIHITSAS
jgi:hypothetical protein